MKQAISALVIASAVITAFGCSSPTVKDESAPPKAEQTKEVTNEVTKVQNSTELSQLPPVVPLRSDKLFWKGKWYTFKLPEGWYARDYEAMGDDGVAIVARASDDQWHLYYWNASTKTIEDLQAKLKLEKNQCVSAIAGDGQTFVAVLGEVYKTEVGSQGIKTIPEVFVLKNQLQDIKRVSLPFKEIRGENVDFVDGSMIFVQPDKESTSRNPKCHLAFVDEKGSNTANVKYSGYDRYPADMARMIKISPDKKRIAHGTGGYADDLRIQNLETGEDVELFEETRVMHGWNPDGTLWCYVTSAAEDFKPLAYREYDPKTNKMIKEIELPNRDEKE